ncbi:MarR family winged helix-turn-helix transcriptional regulator [[Mycobacterium] nativiensis]|uniref:MarR family transcriptional regulator n=1 Tax=[Mycobacterium] nativiensis TaxID=2855503 RepID=A0ABU5XZ31_9MYCO|nr:MarR family transcriptional regulator [Mycolicibacter sp. MYC340]MEB3033259.1 MarR family transcriptional regulator [Mycolicibacter sp. MYC340]
MSATLSGRQAQAWGAYIESSIHLETRLDEALREQTGLTLIDYHLLMLLAGAPEHRMRMSELADRMVFSRSRITYQISSMTKRGLTVRESVPDDRRGYRAVLTATGLQTLHQAMPLHAASVRALFLDDLDADEMAYVERIFSRLRDRLGNERKVTS